MYNEIGNESPDRDDPFDLLFTHQKSSNELREEESPKNYNRVKPDEKMTESEVNVTLFKEEFKYDHGYTVSLTYQNEDALMDTYLNENLNENDKQKEDPSDYFNFGFDEEKWIKFLNKNILMHYERHLIQQQMNPEANKLMPNVGQPIYPTGNIRPMVPGAMPNYPPGFPYPYRFMPYPGMMYPYHPMNPNPIHNPNLSQEEPKK